MWMANDDDISKRNIKVDDMEKRTRKFGHQFNVRVGYSAFSIVCGNMSHVSHAKSGSSYSSSLDNEAHVFISSSSG